MVKTDPRKKTSTATQTLPETLKDGTESASNLSDTSGEFVHDSTQEGHRNELEETVGEPEHSEEKDPEGDSKVAKKQVQAKPKVSKEMKELSHLEDEDSSDDGEDSSDDTNKGQESTESANGSKDDVESSDQIVSPDPSHQSKLALNKETTTAINTDELHARTIGQDQYDSINRTVENSEGDMRASGTEHSEEMEGGLGEEVVEGGAGGEMEIGQDEGANVGSIGEPDAEVEEAVRVRNEMEISQNGGNTDGRLEAIDEMDSEEESEESELSEHFEDEEHAEEVKGKTVIVRIPYGGDEQVDMEWMAMDQRVAQFMDDGEWSVSTFSETGDSDEVSEAFTCLQFFSKSVISSYIEKTKMPS
jgi:hypothetical protein